MSLKLDNITFRMDSVTNLLVPNQSNRDGLGPEKQSQIKLFREQQSSPLSTKLYSPDTDHMNIRGKRSSNDVLDPSGLAIDEERYKRRNKFSKGRYSLPNDPQIELVGSASLPDLQLYDRHQPSQQPWLQ